MAARGNGKTILLAEDDPTVRTLVLTLLQLAGYAVIVAVDGQDALEQSRQVDGAIDLLVTDINMPRMTGFELAMQIQIERPLIKVLVMSGMTAVSHLPDESWQFLQKPFKRDMLDQRVQRILQD